MPKEGEMEEMKGMVAVLVEETSAAYQAGSVATLYWGGFGGIPADMAGKILDERREPLVEELVATFGGDVRQIRTLFKRHGF